MVKSYKGGYSILDTTPITFEQENSGVTITDTYILEQLLEILKPHYYNWEKDLKPIYLRYISDSVGVCVSLCTLVHQSDGEFYINANLEHSTIQIYVELIEDVDGNILINDCTYSYSTLTQVVNLEITGGNIEVGTKLCKHTIVFSNSDEILFISNHTTPYQNNESDIQNIISDIILFGGNYYNEYDGFDTRILAIQDDGNGNFNIYGLDDTLISLGKIIVGMSDFTDTVTPL